MAVKAFTREYWANITIELNVFSLKRDLEKTKKEQGEFIHYIIEYILNKNLKVSNNKREVIFNSMEG